MSIRKEKKIKVVPTTTGRMEGGDNHLFYSYDDSSARFVFEFKNPDGTALDLLNATPQALLILHEESGDKKVVTEELGTISVIDGLVSFVIPDNVLGFRGKCDLYIALAFADGSSSDEVHVAFTIEESPFNKTYEEAADYYIKSFDVLLKEVELAKTNAINKINEQLPQVQSRLENVENGLRVAEGELEELLDGMNLQTMYSNSIDFGGYDYSGNPNLMRVIKASDFRRQGDSDVLISDVGYNSIRLASQGVNHIWTYTETDIPSLVSGKTYTISAKVKIEEGATGNIDQITVSYRKALGGTTLLAAISDGAVVGKEIIIKGTSTVNYEIAELSRFYLDIEVAGVINGSVIVSDVKIEEGSTATPYQPNLLDAPYYLSKAALGENIADSTKTFPINSSANEIYKGNMKEDLVIGQTYTITLKGTKPASQTFTAYNFWNVNFGNLKPVEGLTDVWSLTFTPTKLEPGLPKDLRIFQMPKETAGACQIDWFKIEKGNTRTPNIEQYKYRGIGMRDSNNPKDYVWDLAPEYVEDNLATDVKISEITGKANKYTDNAIAAVNTNVVNTADDLARQINSNKTAAESYANTKKEEAITDANSYTNTKKEEAIVTANNYTNTTIDGRLEISTMTIDAGFTSGWSGWVKLNRFGDMIVVSYSLSPTANTGTWATPLPIASIPAQFQFESSAYGTGSIAVGEVKDCICQVGMNEHGLQFAAWNRTSGSAAFAGQVSGVAKNRKKALR